MHQRIDQEIKKETAFLKTENKQTKKCFITLKVLISLDACLKRQTL